MEIKQTTCGNCGGSGRVIVWRTTKDSERLGVSIAKAEEDTCPTCKGEGFIEYPIFTVEEAKVILKHCGLSTED
jgi:DnaJ-class molecular chaperone